MSGVLKAVGIIAIVVVALVAAVIGITYIAGGTIGGTSLFTFSGNSENAEVDPENILDSPSTDEAVDIQHLSFPKRTIHEALCFFFDKYPPFLEHEPHIENLHMDMWGITGLTATEVVTDYTATYQDQGYEIYDQGMDSGTGWESQSVIYVNGNNARAIIVADGPSVEANYGYETIISTSYGLLTDYVSYVNFLSRY